MTLITQTSSLLAGLTAVLAGKKPVLRELGMASFRAGLVAAAVASVIVLPLGGLPARAQSVPASQVPASQVPASQVPASQVPASQVPASQVPATDQAKDLNRDQPKDQGQTAAQNESQASEHVQPQTVSQTCPGNPDALGTSRVLPIDFSVYQQLGSMQYPDSLPLNDKEVVITFDDGPLPPSTDKVLDALAAQCVKATFFMVGEMARSFPATVRRVYEEGHTIGTHSDHHPIGFGKLPLDRMDQEIDGGIADVSAAFGGDSRYLAPFFRIPGFARSNVVEHELAERGLIVFSADVVADDWHRDITPAKIISLAMSRLEKRGKGILLLHDIHPKTAAALPGLLQQLKEQGFHVVQVVPSAAYEMAMALRPASHMLASLVTSDLAIDTASAVPPAWPPTSNGVMPDDIVLPVPDPSAFEPDTVLDDASAAVEWPAVPKSVAAAPARQENGERNRHRRLAVREDRRKTRTAHAVEHERIERGPHNEHSHTHAHANDGDHADLMSRIRAVAALFSPAQTAR
jgi:peptidoglycan/xylan/chitin deacetylase (PgdA/CDA1 family)